MKQLTAFLLALVTTTAWGVGLGDLDKLKEKIDSTPLTKESVTEAVKQATPKKAQVLLPVSQSEEIKVGREVTANMLGAAPLVKDAALQHYVNEVGRWVSLHSERPDLPWHFGVIDSSDINAFAAPGGYVLITRGLYQRLASEEELAGVLAHEVAHIIKRHHIDLMRKQAAIAEGGKAAERAAGDENQVVKNLVGNGAEIFARRLDQNAEIEADRMAVVIAARSGYDPYGLPAALQKLEVLPGSDDRLKLLFKTHPTPAQRLDMLRREMGNSMLSLSGSSGGKFYHLK